MRRLLEDGSLYEVRILDLPRNNKAAGYFDNVEDLLREILPYDSKGNLYITLNPVNPALKARSANRIKERPEKTTSDNDILKRRWILIDVDPVRPSGISASDEEKELAKKRAHEAYLYLKAQEWPEPIAADSGNGYHLLYRIDLPNDEVSRDLIKNCLNALALRFDDKVVSIDTTVFNAGRIVKFYGTMAVKGDNLPERPHRRSGVKRTPEEIQVVPVEKLRALAEQVPKEQTKPRSHGDGFDLDRWIGEHNVGIAFGGPWNGGTRYVLDHCPWNSDHTNRSAFIIKFGNGAIAAGCHHNGCRGKGWHDLRDVYEPGWRQDREKRQEQWESKKQKQSNGDKEPPQRIIRAVCMADVEPEEVQWLWYPYIPLGKLTLLEGDPAAGKTFIALAISGAVSNGSPLPNNLNGREIGWKEPANVIYMSAEDGISDTLRPRLDMLGANVKNIYAITGVVEDEKEGAFSFDNLLVLDVYANKVKPKLIVCDPLQAFLGAKMDMHRANETRPVLSRLMALAERHRCAVICLRHLNKSAGGKGLYRGMGSIDFTAAARSVLLAGNDPKNIEVRAIVQTKSSLAPVGANQGYALEVGKGFSWTGISDLTATEILNGEGGKEKGGKLEDAIEWLKEELESGPKEVKTVEELAKIDGISAITLRRASEKLEVEKYRKTGEKNPPWLWELPHTQYEQVEQVDDLFSNINASTCCSTSYHEQVVLS